jgi:hypothetical protein
LVSRLEVIKDVVLFLLLFRVNKVRAAIGLPLNLEEGRKDMRKQVFGFFTMLSLLLVLTTASVNAQSKRSFINIPFSFTVGQKTLPAGDYTIAPVRKDSHNVWQVESRSRDTIVLFTTMPVWGSKTPGETSLVFNKYDGQYFLSQILTGGDNSGRVLRMRRSERALAKSASEREKVVVTLNSGD